MNYEEMSLAQLKDIAKELKIKSAYKLKKIELLEEIKKVKSEIEATVYFDAVVKLTSIRILRRN